MTESTAARTNTDLAIGNSVAEIVERALRDATGEGSPSLLLTNFMASEVAALAERLEGTVLDGFTNPIEIVVSTDDPADDIPDRFRLPEGRTLTSYRNTSTSGLVLALIGEASDSQGLGQLFRLNDRDVLQPDGDGRFQWAPTLVREAWKLAGDGELTDPPETLLALLEQVLKGVSAREPMPLRVWARYVSCVCGELRAQNRAIDSEEVKNALGRMLVDLGLFPHVTLFDERARVERHLERNRLFVQGQNPSGKEDLVTHVWVGAEG